MHLPLVSRGVHWLARRVWPRLGVCFAQEHLAVVGSLSFAIAVVRGVCEPFAVVRCVCEPSQSFGAHGLCALLRAEAGECGHRWHRGRTWRDARAERAPRSVGRAGSRQGGGTCGWEARGAVRGVAGHSSGAVARVAAASARTGSRIPAPRAAGRSALFFLRVERGVPADPSHQPLPLADAEEALEVVGAVVTATVGAAAV